jgi:hypothetical protein
MLRRIKQLAAGAGAAALLSTMGVAIASSTAQAAPAIFPQTTIEVQTSSMTVIAYCTNVTAARVHGLTQDTLLVARQCSAEPGLGAGPPPRRLHAPARVDLVLPGWQLLVRCTSVAKIGDEALFTQCTALT